MTNVDVGVGFRLLSLDEGRNGQESDINPFHYYNSTIPLLLGDGIRGPRFVRSDPQ